MAKRKNNRPTPVVGPPSNPEPPPPVEPSARYRFYASRVDRKLSELAEAERRLDLSSATLRELLRDANSTIKALRAERTKAEETIQAIKGALHFLAEQEISDILRSEMERALGELSKAMAEEKERSVNKIVAEFDKLRDLLMGVVDAKGRKRKEPTLDEVVLGVVAEKSGLLPGSGGVQGERLSSDDPPPAFGG